MSFKKRRCDSSSDSVAGQTALRDVESSDTHDAELDLRQQLAAMRTQRDHWRAQAEELTAVQLENESLRAAALAPCPRCNFHSDWTVRVRTMAGQVHTIDCPDGPATLIVHVKQELAKFDPKYFIQAQLTLVLFCETTSCCSSADSSDSALADDRTLESYGISQGDLLELLLVDMNWSASSLQMIEQIKSPKIRDQIRVDFLDDDRLLALSWALVNAVCLVFNRGTAQVHF